MARKNKEFGIAKADTEFGNCLLESLREAIAHKKGEIDLPTRHVVSVPVTDAKKRGPYRKQAV